MRVELIEYYKTYIPDSSNFSCPLTNNSYLINIDNENKNYKVMSPITKDKPHKESRFLVFSLKSKGHGGIIDGSPSWD